MLKVKLYFFSSFFLVEVVCFFVTYGLARNKTGSVKDGITELYQKKNNFEVFISRIA
jgi:ATP/ADP translocase